MAISERIQPDEVSAAQVGPGPGLERMARAAGGAYDRSQAVRVVVDEAYQQVECDQVFLLSPSPYPSSVRVEAVTPTNGGHIRSGDTWDLGAQSGQVFERCWHHSDAQAEPCRRLSEHLAKVDLHGWVGLPLRTAHSERALGTLGIASRDHSAPLGWTDALRPLVSTAAEALLQLQQRGEGSPDQPLLCAEGCDLERMQALGNLAFGVSHSLGNIFGAIMGNLHFLGEEVDGSAGGERAGEFIEKLEQSVCAGADMMQSLQQFAGKSESGMQHFDAGMLAGEVMAFVGRLCGHSGGAETSLHLHMAEGCVAWGCPAQVRECLINIIFNAIWAAGDSGSVDMAGRVENGRCVLTISDDGPGMTSEVRRRAAEPFFTTREDGHQGLGLSVARGIVVAHRGQLTIQTAPGLGARVEVTLPTGPPTDAQATDALITEALARIG